MKIPPVVLLGAGALGIGYGVGSAISTLRTVDHRVGIKQKQSPVGIAGGALGSIAGVYLGVQALRKGSDKMPVLATLGVGALVVGVVGGILYANARNNKATTAVTTPAGGASTTTTTVPSPTTTVRPTTTTVRPTTTTTTVRPTTTTAAPTDG